MENRDATKHKAPKDGTSQKVFLAVGGTAYLSCKEKEKVRPKGKGESKGKGNGELGKGKNKGHSFGLYGPQLVDVLEGCTVDAESAWQDTWDCQENEWQHIGMLGKVSKVKPTEVCVSGPRCYFNELSSDNEEPQKQGDPCCSKEDSIACEDRRVTVDIRDLIKHSTGKCPKTLREDGSRNLRECNMESQTRRKRVVTLNDMDELDAIIEESRKISALTKITECVSPRTETKPDWKRVSMAVDSGACENVIDAEEMVPGFEIKQTKAIMIGIKYASATGEEILNLGGGSVANDHRRRNKATNEASSSRSIATAGEREAHLRSRPHSCLRRYWKLHSEQSHWRDQCTPRGMWQLHARSMGSADK